MANQRRIAWILMLAACLLVAVSAAEASARVLVRPHHGGRYNRGPSNFEFVVEGGMALPAGDQGDDLDFAGPAKGADTGYEVGFRFRQFVSPNLAISPAFHYVDFGKASGYGDFDLGDGLGYKVETSLMRYGVDFQYFMPTASAGAFQPYLTMGLGLIHNRYRDELEYYGDYEASANTPGVSLGVGFQAGSLEMSGVYTFNRFSSDEMASGLNDLDYNWDYLSVRLGLAFGDR